MIKQTIDSKELQQRAKIVFTSYFDGLITEDEAIADSILKGCGAEFGKLLQSFKSQYNR